MPWEQRGSHRYYYRSRRKGSVVEKQYLGKGPVAELAARQDAEVSRKRTSELATIRRLDECIASIAAVMVDLDGGAQILCDAMLLAAGFHQHRGTWRRRRERQSKSN